MLCMHFNTIVTLGGPYKSCTAHIPLSSFPIRPVCRLPTGEGGSAQPEVELNTRCVMFTLHSEWMFLIDYHDDQPNE